MRQTRQSEAVVAVTTTRPNRVARPFLLFILILVALACAAGSAAEPTSGGRLARAAASSPASEDDASRAGEALFTGQTRFQNGGPACATCHSAATLPFPGGGAMAPDLTHEYSKLGPQGMHYALRTLYFPAMNALFLKRQLTDQEEAELAAFFQDADRSPPARERTGTLAGAAVLGLAILAAITWKSGRGRVHSVRRNLLERAGQRREKR